MKTPLLVLACLWLLASGPERSEAQQDSATGEIAGLFIAACLDFAGNRDGTRTWLTQHHVPALTAQGRAVFLKDRNGVGYNASNKVSRLALVSEDDGSCTAFGERADAQQLTNIIEAKLRDLKFVFKAESQHDALINGVPQHHSSYIIEKNARRFDVVISTSAVIGRIQAMLTLSPRS